VNHLDLDALADLLVGAGTAGQADHLRSCHTCTQHLADLDLAQAPVTEALSALPAPEVPAALAARLAAAATAPRAAASVVVLPLAPHRHRHRLAAAAGIAAAVVLVGGVALLAQAHRGAAPTSALSAARPAPPVRRVATGTAYRAATFAAQLAPLLSGPAKADSTRTATGSTPGAQAAPQAGAGRPAGRGVSQELAALQGTPALAACLSALTPANEPGLPLVVDYASYAGRPALIVALPSTRPGKVDVFVVGPRCAAADPDVRYFTRLARP
jgi:hypothetical protein